MKYIRIQLILTFLFTPLFAWTNSTVEDNTLIEISSIDQEDTINITEQPSEENIVKFYQEILEKTNSQLSLWWNPYGAIIALLGVLFTVMTIIAAFLIYRQSKEHKELLQKSITEYGNVIDKMIKERFQQLKNMEKNLETTISEYKTKLTIETESNKSEIEKFIQTLEKQKESVDLQIKKDFVVPKHEESYSYAHSLLEDKPRLHKCSSCGYGYMVKNDPDYLTQANFAFGSGSKTIKCPKCGNVETYY